MANINGIVRFDQTSTVGTDMYALQYILDDEAVDKIEKLEKWEHASVDLTNIKNDLEKSGIKTYNFKWDKEFIIFESSERLRGLENVVDSKFKKQMDERLIGKEYKVKITY
jgi:hypothetical protein